MLVIRHETKAAELASAETLQQLQSRVEKYEHFILQNGQERFVGHGGKFPRVSLVSPLGATISTDFSESHVALVLLFSDTSCQSCVYAQFRLMAHFHQILRHPEKSPILAIGNTSESTVREYIRAFSLLFPVARDTSGVFFGKRRFSHRTPAVYVVDDENVVLQVHYPTPKMPHLSALFFNEIRRYLILRETPFDRCYTGVSYPDAVSGNFDQTKIEEFLF